MTQANQSLLLTAQAAFAWGHDFLPGDRHMANTWQGDFPWQHRCRDG